MLDELAEEIHQIAKSKGFYDDGDRHDGISIALMHSELSEALEASRDDDMVLMEEELADVIIRILDTAHYRGLSMDRAIRLKMEKNRGRPRLHGRKW